MSEVPLPKLPSLRGAAWLGLAVLVGLTALVPLLNQDRADRADLERITATSAVGDDAVLKHRARGPVPVLSYQGKPLVPVSPRHLELRDSKMTFAAMEDGGQLRLYTTAEAVPWEKGEVEVKGQPVYFVKIEPNQYLRVQ